MELDTSSSSKNVDSTSSSTIEKMPMDITIKIFAYIGTKYDIGIICASVCKGFNEIISSSQHLWKEVAYLRYGTKIAEQTIQWYHNNDWKSMVKDDNAFGAFPTIANFNRPCYWKFNSSHRYYCCLITCIKWDRIAQEVRLYIHVCGEHDLRSPIESTINLSSSSDGVQRLFQGIWRTENPSSSSHTIMQQQQQQHNHNRYHKGYIAFAEECFNYDGIYSFCYANLFRNRFTDYQTIPIFTIQPKQNLRSIFMDDDNNVTYTLANISPFHYDNDQLIVKSRWEKFMDRELIRRHFMEN